MRIMSQLRPWCRLSAGNCMSVTQTAQTLVLVGVGSRPARVQGAAWTEGRRAPRPPSPGRYLYNRSLCVRRNVNTLTLPSPQFTTNGPKSVLVHKQLHVELLIMH
ncbi:unnamed protein product [Arctia plantaginis]|uniref:Uncharacterized protein n=1 Tax=Arctia plantaginis TaxID=874455 RepID=A0A8S1B5A7_ARCPL|nr:unnamed protein product [Arctia plantaginis]